jgi:dynein heavy chain, axonemal
LMRALRDMNMPKFVYEDVPLFQGLIEDLFPGLACERVGYDDLKEKIATVLELGKFMKKENEELKKVYED